MPPDQREQRYQPLTLIGVTLVTLLGFAVFFVSFLVAPLAILAIFYITFAASDRAKRNNGKAKAKLAGDAGAEPPPDPAAKEPAKDERRPNGSAALLAHEPRARRDVLERSDEARRAELSARAQLDQPAA